MPEICVAHLVWTPLGRDPLERFLASYRTQAAGEAHRLLIIWNGRSDNTSLSLLDGFDADLLEVPSGVLDLHAYRLAAGEVEESTICFLNSYSELLTDGWLAALQRQLRQPGVGLVGATGSFESVASSGPRPLRPLLRRFFAPAPNPHVRTNAFMLRRDLLLDLQWPLVKRKWQALLLENGRKNITRQIQDRGLETLVVGRDGKGYRPHEWPLSRTFRTGEQENLLVADNRTRQYAEADPEFRRLLASYAWGSSAIDG